jgi:hypothetical protein
VTFKDLKKRVVSVTAQEQQQSRLSEILKDKPFWIWNIEEHKREDVRTDGYCCFNHIIDLPQRNGIDKPLYDYEKIIMKGIHDYSQVSLGSVCYGDLEFTSEHK